MSKRKAKPTAAKLVRTQQATVAALLNSALHHLGETNLPYIVIIGERVLSNVAQLHVQAIILKQADLIRKIQDVENERTAERIADYGEQG
jgi:hypothetical protein